jgi:hypothetical protein
MNYTVAEVMIPNKGIFYTARNDNRTPEQVVADGIAGFANGIQSDIYKELDSEQKCSVQDIFTGLSKEEAEAKSDLKESEIRNHGCRSRRLVESYQKAKRYT